MRNFGHISYLHVLRAHKCLGCTRSSEIKAPPCSFIPGIGEERTQNGKAKANLCLYQCLYKTTVKYNIFSAFVLCFGSYQLHLRHPEWQNTE